MLISDLPFEERYSLPPIAEIDDSPREIERKQARIRERLRERDAILLAHNYQRDEVQEVADFVGDSLGLSQQAARTSAQVIVFCGVHFMAETASILCQDKIVLLPDLRAGCSLAASLTVEELREWKAKHPTAVVVSYVNTSAAVKAESDYCCTSANAAKVVASIPEDRPVLFFPDKFLGAFVALQTGRKNLIAYPGYCHVHRTIRSAQVVEMLEARPQTELLIHPECGCVSSCMTKVLDGTLPQRQTFFLSTEGMFRHVDQSKSKEFAVGTEVGMLHRLRQRHPEREFLPINPEAVCAFMKTITLDNILTSLETLSPEVRVPAETARKARRAVDRMLDLV
jgi:quinolinate synthase